jgi:CheY-like chemotaxis protein
MSLNLSGKTALVVDDERFSRTIVAQQLKDMGALSVLMAGDGIEALDLMAKHGKLIAFVIADFNMPVMHGLELLKAIRIGDGHVDRATPVAMVTGYSDKGLVDLALALDVNAFVIKPVSKESLEKRLGRMFDHGGKDLWLKSALLYEDIGVASALNDVLGTGKTSEDEGKARRVYVKRKDEPLFRNPAEEETETDVHAHELEDEATAAEHSATGEAPRRQLHGYSCALKHIPKEGAILARDVHTADGRLFMHAGSELTPRIVSILFDLQDLDHPVEEIWVASEEQPDDEPPA